MAIQRRGLIVTTRGRSRRWRPAIALVAKSLDRLKNAAAAQSGARRPQIWRWRSERKQTLRVRERQQHGRREVNNVERAQVVTHTEFYERIHLWFNIFCNNCLSKCQMGFYRNYSHCPFILTRDQMSLSLIFNIVNGCYEALLALN